EAAEIQLVVPFCPAVFIEPLSTTGDDGVFISYLDVIVEWVEYLDCSIRFVALDLLARKPGIVPGGEGDLARREIIRRLCAGGVLEHRVAGDIGNRTGFGQRAEIHLAPSELLPAKYLCTLRSICLSD